MALYLDVFDDSLSVQITEVESFLEKILFSSINSSPNKMEGELP